MLAGARACFDREGVLLVGGHSSEGPDLAAGFSVTGDIAPDKIARKSGLRTGDALVLTKPLGTGILFAAAMRAQAKAPWIEHALGEMRRSGRAAASILLEHGATAMTDVSGRARELVIRSRHEAGQMVVEVRDAGVGIEADNLDRLFNAFFTTKSQGTGLGLAITRSIVESHGGRIWATANSGPGATFQFTLPIRETPGR